ncbi:hypothetical protein V5O48_016426 [Marasmius crinis-equi]|uniref:Uncharacterized protein n=1 Tax=Marasmius crinis-equi TaxID=585013 RepID=A0ABR3ES16_9AGAR
MGSLCSKPDAHEGGHTVLGSSSSHSGTTAALSQSANSPDRRNAAAEAAERRMKAAQERGTNQSNPNRGKLAAQAAQPAKFTPERREEERLVWD